MQDQLVKCLLCSASFHPTNQKEVACLSCFFLWLKFHRQLHGQEFDIPDCGTKSSTDMGVS